MCKALDSVPSSTIENKYILWLHANEDGKGETPVTTDNTHWLCTSVNTTLGILSVLFNLNKTYGADTSFIHFFFLHTENEKTNDQKVING